MNGKETKLKYFKGSEWMKTSDKLAFNLDATELAEQIPGTMDENQCFHVTDRTEELSLLPSTKPFEVVKANVREIWFALQLSIGG